MVIQPNPVLKKASLFKIDLGCGGCKREGTIGLDSFPQPGVDYVLNLTKDPIPLPDRSVEYVYSSHFLEHIQDDDWTNHIFPEISRVCVSGAKLELWTPYNWSNSAFILGHRKYINEDDYLHLCVWHYKTWEPILKARWLLQEICYVVPINTLVDLHRHGVSLDFALRYFKGIVQEVGMFIEIQHDYQGPVVEPKRTFAITRDSEHYVVKPDQIPFNWSDVEAAIQAFQD
jgi:hypothetical protein